MSWPHLFIAFYMHFTYLLPFGVAMRSNSDVPMKWNAKLVCIKVIFFVFMSVLSQSRQWLNSCNFLCCHPRHSHPCVDGFFSNVCEVLVHCTDATLNVHRL